MTLWFLSVIKYPRFIFLIELESFWGDGDAGGGTDAEVGIDHDANTGHKWEGSEGLEGLKGLRGLAEVLFFIETNELFDGGKASWISDPDLRLLLDEFKCVCPLEYSFFDIVVGHFGNRINNARGLDNDLIELI